MEKSIVPPSAAVGIAIVSELPKTEHRVIRLLEASLINLIVQVPAVADVLVFDKIRLYPPEFKPSTVTLSAPLKVNNEMPDRDLLMVRDPAAPPGLMVRLAQELPFRKVDPSSPEAPVILAVTVTTILFPVCEFAFNAANKPVDFVKVV